MLKKIAIGLAVLIVVAGIGLAYLYTNLDSIIRMAIEKYGTAATQTTVRLDTVKLSLTSGQGALAGLSVDNPKGFNTGVKAFYLGSISVQVDASSIQGSGPIVIKEIDIEKPQINYEVTTAGDTNLGVLQRNAITYSNTMKLSATNPNANKATGADKTPQNGGRKIIISDLYIKDGQIGISAQLLKDKNLTAPLPDLHLTNIGKANNGATVADVTQQILSALTASVGKVATGVVANNLVSMKDLKTLGGTATDATSNVTNQVKGLFGN